MPITYKDETGKNIVTHLAPGVSAEQAAIAMHLAPGTWQEISEAEAAALMQPTLEEARAAKLAEIVTGANAVKAALSSRFSALEESTWPEQEAGARAILDDAANAKDATARLILMSETGTAAAVSLVKQLATVDGSTPEAFAQRIVINADMAHLAGIGTLMEQLGYEKAVHEAETAGEIEAIVVGYSVMKAG